MAGDRRLGGSMWLPSEAADRSTVVAVVAVGRVDVARVEAEVVGAASTRLRSRRPIAPVVACAPQRPRVDVPAGMENKGD